MRPAKTQISLRIRQVWSESSLSAWRKLGSLTTHWAHSEDSDQAGQLLNRTILKIEKENWKPKKQKMYVPTRIRTGNLSPVLHLTAWLLRRVEIKTSESPIYLSISIFLYVLTPEGDIRRVAVNQVLGVSFFVFFFLCVMLVVLVVSERSQCLPYNAERQER